MHRYIFGQIYLPACNGQTIFKCVNIKTFFLFFIQIQWSCSYLYLLKLHQVSLNSNEKQKSFLMTHLMDAVKGRWIRLHQITDYKSAEHSSDDILNIMKKPDLISNFSFSLWRHFSISENNKYQTSCKFLMRHEDLAMQASHITFSFHQISIFYF